MGRSFLFLWFLDTDWHWLRGLLYLLRKARWFFVTGCSLFSSIRTVCPIGGYYTTKQAERQEMDWRVTMDDGRSGGAWWWFFLIFWESCWRNLDCGVKLNGIFERATEKIKRKMEKVQKEGHLPRRSEERKNVAGRNERLTMGEWQRTILLNFYITFSFLVYNSDKRIAIE